jgi:hypothetical protein
MVSFSWYAGNPRNSRAFPTSVLIVLISISLWHDACSSPQRKCFPLTVHAMSQLDNVNPISEHNLYLTLYVSSSGGV